MPAAKTVTIDVSASTSLRGLPRPRLPTWPRLAEAADVIKLMTYDQHGPTWSGPGPIGALALAAPGAATPSLRVVPAGPGSTSASPATATPGPAQGTGRSVTVRAGPRGWSRATARAPTGGPRRRRVDRPARRTAPAVVVGPAVLPAAGRAGPRARPARTGGLAARICGHPALSAPYSCAHADRRPGHDGRRPTPPAPVNLGGPKQRALLAALALHRGRAVAVDTLADLIWDGTPPPGVSGTLQGYVAGLRRALEPDRTTRGGGTLLVTEQPGYALRLPDDDLDTVGVRDRRVSARTPRSRRSPTRCAAAGRCPPGSPDAGGLAALHDVARRGARRCGAACRSPTSATSPAAEAERARLEELRVLATEDRAALGILLGLHATVAAELDALTRQHPLRERAWALRALALAGSGRQADALAVLRAGARRARRGARPRARAPSCAPSRPRCCARRRPPPPSRRRHRAAPRAPRPDEHAPLPFPTLWRWSLAGRDEELAALTALVDQVVAGTGAAPPFAALTGEPGIGKSRLAIELATYADRAGHDHRVGSLLAGRRRAGAVAVGDGARAARLRAALEQRSRRRRRRGVPRLGDRRRRRCSPQPRSSRCCWSSTTCTGPTPPACGCCGCSPRRRPPTSPAPAAGGGHLARAPAADRRARRGRRGAGAQARAAAPAARHLRGRAAQVFAPGLRGRADRRRDADALRRRTEGNPFFLVEYARLARDAATSPR